ncbi:MAG TPA: AI-2E family transporter [Candidatus Dormibacteraeota bacterium]|nr:AI-2E family transporter [Candidatus Dormibacteraeota bacterium]
MAPDNPAASQARVAKTPPATPSLSEAPTVPPPGDAPPGTWGWVRAAAITVTIFVAYQLLLVLAGWLTTILTVILAVVLAVAITFIADPVVGLLQRRAHFPPTLAVLTTLVVGLLFVGGVLYIVGGPLVGEARGLADQIPHLLHRANTEITHVRAQLSKHGIQVAGGGVIPKNLTSYIPGATDILLHGLSSTVTVLVDVFVGLVISFWLLKDGRILRRQFQELLPGRLRSEVSFGFDAFSVVVGGYVRAQLLMALLVAILAGVGTAILGVPFPLVIAVATFIFELIPLVGPFAGGAVALLLALTKSPELAIFTLVLFLAIHIIEGYLLAPRIQAKFVRLHPLIALLALFGGIEAAGFLGALLAVPVASLFAVFLRVGVLDWRHNRPDLFGARAAQEAAEVGAPGRRVLREFTPIHKDLWRWIKRRTHHTR